MADESNLVEQDGTNSPQVAQMTSASSEEATLKSESQLRQGNDGDASMSKMLTSREASMRIAQDDGEPPPIDKKTLLGLIAVYFSVFLDMMGISIVQPVLPFYAEKFGANSFELGALYSSYSLMATFASYFMGKASDKYGRRPSILFSLFGTMLGFTITGLATSYETLLAYRFITGAFGGSAPIAQAYISDVVPSSQRPRYLAMTGATAALSFIIGPGIGSGLSEFGIRIPFFVSGGLGGFGLIFAYFVLHESHPRVKNGKKNDDVTQDDVEMKVQQSDSPDSPVAGSPGSHSPSDSKGDLIVKKEDGLAHEIYILAALNIFNMMGWTSYTSMFAYYIILKYGISTLAVGYITLSLATLYVFTNLIIFSQLSKRIGVYMCTVVGLLIFTVFLAILPLPNNLWLTLICIGIGAGLGNGMVFPAMSAMAADYSNPSNRGKVMAFSNASQNIGMVIGPLLHGVLYEIEPDLVFYVAAACVFCAWLCILYLVIKEPQLRHPPVLKVKATEGIDVKDEKKWEWVPDKPTEHDYRKLGKFLGKLLLKRNYNWVSHYDPLSQFLKDIFPPVRTGSLQEHIEDIEFLRANISNMRSEYDAAHAQYNVAYA